MLNAVIVDLSGIATLITLITAIAIAAKAYPFTRLQLTALMFTVSAGCIVGSLFMSEVLKLTPCNLCWWQRIFMYPVAILSGISLIRKNTENLFINTVGLSIPGLLTALFNVYLQYAPTDTAALICDPNNPCSEIDVIALNLLTLPMMSAVAFIFMLTCAWSAGESPDRMESIQ